MVSYIWIYYKQFDTLKITKDTKSGGSMNKHTLRRLTAFILTILIIMGTTVTAFAEPETEKITISDAKYPSGALTLGSSFSLRGIISTYSEDDPLVIVWGGIYNSDGSKPVMYYEFFPDGNTSNIYYTFDDVISFGSLPVGDYLYIISAEDSEGNTAVLINSPFSIEDNSIIPSDISLTGESLPADTLPEHCVFSIRGLISSTLPLSKVWGGVYNTDGSQTGVYYEDEPGKRSYNLYNTFDDYLSFGSLSAGDYVYKIEAEDYRGFTKTIIEKDFSIVSDDSSESSIEIYAELYPVGTLRYGKSFSIAGQIFSTYQLESVSGGIYKAEGDTSDYNNEYTMTLQPEKRSFNLSELDYYLAFGSLPVGDYVYRVEATDINGFSKTLVESPFRVRNTAPHEGQPEVVMKGVDVSEYQEDIDWNKVYADGIDFAVLRAGYTSTANAEYYEDELFEDHYAGAKAAGLKVGAYIYTSAFNRAEMKSNIEQLIETLDGKDFDMPIYIDVETDSRQIPLGRKALTELVAYGCELLQDAGYETGVYASLSWYMQVLDMDVLEDSGNEIWLAVYFDDFENDDMSELCTTWQYTSSGEVDGIPIIVDVNLRYAALSAGKYEVAVAETKGGNVSVNKSFAGHGERVTITATPDEYYEIGAVTVNGNAAIPAADGSYSFLMPDEAALVVVDFLSTVEYEKVEAVPAGHTPLPAAKENKTSAAYDEVVYCEVCGKELSRVTVITEEPVKPSDKSSDKPAENESKPERSPKTADGLNPLRLALISVVCVLGVLGIRKLHRNPSLPR